MAENEKERDYTDRERKIRSDVLPEITFPLHDTIKEAVEAAIDKAEDQIEKKLDEYRDYLLEQYPQDKDASK